MIKIKIGESELCINTPDFIEHKVIQEMVKTLRKNAGTDESFSKKACFLTMNLPVPMKIEIIDEQNSMKMTANGIMLLETLDYLAPPPPSENEFLKEGDKEPKEPVLPGRENEFLKERDKESRVEELVPPEFDNEWESGRKPGWWKFWKRNKGG